MPLVYICLGLLLLVLMQPRGNNTCLYTGLAVDKMVHQIHHEKESWFLMTMMAVLPHDFTVVRFLLLALSITNNHKEIPQETLVSCTVSQIRYISVSF